ncbi:Signal transduction histidine kinase [Micromonospora citrea]|uniref:histidine kinase n=1 Tax=Micromonospora citrea TaxID=47855 RepID=A0A1C6U792_9ACTN|nr:histidine kinase [Micromonospora citrea]SCL49887.1 Signal transduction histidine kinase [Micromonospora citrea]
MESERGGGWWSRAEVRRRSGDVLLWLVTGAPIGYAGATPPHSGRTVALTAGALLLLAAAVALSRRWPVAALVVAVFGSLLDGNFLFAIPVFSYLTGRRSATAVPAALTFAALAAGGTVLNLGLLGTGAATWYLLASVLLFAGVFPWLVGRHRRQQAALADAGRRHAEARHREQRGAAERIRLRERARIAQEMHDSLGHDLSLIALRAAALEVADDLAPAHRTAAGELRASVAAATERLHGIIGVLREEGGAATVRPADETVADLVDRAREAGMAVDVDPPDGLPDLPAATAHTVHRVVREALTNAARYAPGAAVTVALTRDGDRLGVSVVNAPPPAGPLPGPPSTGSGLLALAERVRLAGGALTAGSEGGGFTVRARLPVGDHPAADLAAADFPTGDLAAADFPTGDLAAASVAVFSGDLSWHADPAVDDPAGERPGEAERRLRDARRRVRRSLLTALGAPAGLALVLSLVYYPVVTAGTVLDAETFARMPLGAERAALAGLPRRQLDPPDAVVRPGCEHYTDGNFPLAEPTWRLCFADGRLVSKERITDER